MRLQQTHTFCDAAALGIACGLNHRYEWFVNAQRALAHGSHANILKHFQRLYEAFIAFEKKTACCPEEQAELDKLDEEGYDKLVHRWYMYQLDIIRQRDK